MTVHAVKAGRPLPSDTHSAVADSIADADARGSSWLAAANDARERGLIKMAERCEAKCQFWLDRSNKLRGNGP